MLDKAKNPENLNFTFVHANNVNKRYDSFFQNSGLKEIFGTYHCKKFIFDDSVLITGANLSEDYFLHR